MQWQAINHELNGHINEPFLILLALVFGIVHGSWIVSEMVEEYALEWE